MTTYIKLEDVKKILRGTYPTISIEIGKINSLPSINLDDYRKRKIVCGDPFPPRDR